MVRMLTLAEAATVLRLSPKTLYSWTSRKKVPHIKLGGRLLFNERELEAWLASFRVTPQGYNDG